MSSTQVASAAGLARTSHLPDYWPTLGQADAALKAKVRTELDFHDDVAWLMIAEGQQIEQDQIPDEVRRLASMATDTVLLAGFLACIVVALSEDMPVSTERAVTACSRGEWQQTPPRAVCRSGVSGGPCLADDPRSQFRGRDREPGQS